jgi:hypothetical protein
MSDTLERKTTQTPIPDLSLFMLRLMGIVLVVELAALMLGISFFLIAKGLVFGVLWLAPYWQPAGNILSKITQNAFPLPVATIRKIAWHSAIILVVKIAVAVGIVALGLTVLFQRGFCGQNLICLALTH